MDAIPGKVNHLRFEAPTTPGTYKGQCAEFCGVQHALMLASVRTVPPVRVRHLGLRAARGRHRPRQADLRGSLRAVPRPGGRGPDRASARRERDARAARAAHRAAREREERDAAGRPGLERRASATPSSSTCRRSSRVAVRAETYPGLPGALVPRPVRELDHDRRPQADRDPLPRHLPRLLRGGRDPRAAHAGAARPGGPELPDARLLQRGDDAARDGDGLPRRRADPRRASGTSSCR